MERTNTTHWPTIAKPVPPVAPVYRYDAHMKQIVPNVPKFIINEKVS